MTNNIELLSQHDNFTIGTNSNLTEILANVVKIGTDTSNVTISIPQDISSSYNLILPVRQGASGESLVYGADGQLKWDDPTVLKQVITVFGSNLGSSKVDSGQMSSVSFPANYEASITPLSANTKIFVQFKVNYRAALSSDNQVDFYINKYINSSQTPDKIFSETLYGPYIAAGGFVGQYISNLIDEPNTTDEITYKLGYKINGTVDLSDTLGILGYDASYNNTIVLQEFEGSGVYATSVWNKGADSNGLYYNDGTVHIGSSKDALGSQNTPGVALELSGNLVGTNANFSGNITAYSITVEEAHIGPNTLYINGTRVLNQNESGSVNVYTDQIISESVNGLTIQANGNNGNIILDPSGTGTIQLNGDVELSGGNINAETFIGDLSGNVNAITMTATTTTTNNLSLDGTLTTSNSTRVEGNLIPSVDDTYSLGAPDRVWKDVYIGPGSLYLNGTKILDDSSDTINMRTSENQALNIETSGTGTLTMHSSGTGALNIEGGGPLTINSSGNSALELNSGTGGIDFNTSNTGSINFNTSNSGTINFNSDIVLQGNISMIQTGTSNPINLNDDVNVGENLDVGGNLKVNKIDRKDPLYSGLYLESVKIDGSSITGQLTGNVTGHVTGTVSSLSNLDTDDLTEGSTNQYYTRTRVRGDLSSGTGINYNESTGVFSLPQELSTTSNVQFNNVTVDGTLNSDDITGSNVTVSNDLVVSGNLRVNGTQTIVNSTILDIGDNKIVLNAAGSLRDAGIIANVDGVEHEFIFKSGDSVWYANKAIQSGTGFMGDIQGNLTSTGSLDTTGNINLTNSAINFTYTDVGDGNAANNRFLVVKTSNNDPWFQHKIVQETSDYDTYEISSISDNTGTNTRERLRLGGYQNQFGEIQLVAQNGVKVWSSHSSSNVMGNIECGNVNGNLTGNVVGNVTGNVVGNVTGNVVGDVTGNVSGALTGNVYGVLTGSMTMTGHILPYTDSTYDIGSAEYKIRHMYLSDNSLWIGDEHKLTINSSNNQLEFRRRKTDAIPQSFITEGINDTSQILNIAGEASLSNMSLSKWKHVARNLGITINGKTDIDIDPTDIFDTTETADWQTAVDVKTIADQVSALETLTTDQGTTLTAVETSANLALTHATTISALETSLSSKQNTITETTDLSLRDINSGGNITTTDGYFIGDGSQLTGINEDQTVTITGSGATNVTGTYPNFTITSTDTDTTYSAGTGMSLSGTTFSIGQSVGTSDNVQFNNVTVDGTLNSDNLFLGENGQTPKIDMFFIDNPNGAVWDTKIEIGKSDDFTNSPAYPPNNAYGMNVQANSDGLFVGIETYDNGSNWRPLLKWGDDSTDTPFTINSNYGNYKWEFRTDGRLDIPNVIKGAPGTICKIHILPFIDSDTINISNTYYEDVVNKSFTKTAGTNLLGEVNVNYTINGDGTDSFQARLNFFTLFNVTGSDHEIIYKGGGGGGHRSGGINDAFVYSNGNGVNSSGTQKIYLQSRRSGANDTITFKAGMFKVTELWA